MAHLGYVEPLLAVVGWVNQREHRLFRTTDSRYDEKTSMIFWLLEIMSAELSIPSERLRTVNDRCKTKPTGIKRRNVPIAVIGSMIKSPAPRINRSEISEAMTTAVP